MNPQDVARKLTPILMEWAGIKAAQVDAEAARIAEYAQNYFTNGRPGSAVVFPMWTINGGIFHIEVGKDGSVIV
jgi:hypothetical protein